MAREWSVRIPGGHLKARFGFNNWTFGVWWDRRLRWYGLDLGPLELILRRRAR